MKILRKALYIVPLIILFSIEKELFSQSLYFSQAYSAHLTLNPANTGRFDGDWQAVALYRQQGYNLSDDYQSSYFSFEYPFYFDNQRVDAGIYYSRDNSAGGTLPVDRLNISVANSIVINPGSVVHFGLQGAVVHKQVTWSNITFPDQYNRDTGMFDPGLPTYGYGESVATTYLDMGFGLVYSYMFDQGIVKAGYSMQQVNRPGESFFGIDNNLPVKHVLHAKGDLNTGNSLFFIPTFTGITMNRAYEIMAGVNAGLYIGEWLGMYQNSVITGLHLRSLPWRDSKGIIFSLGGSWQYWNFMLSYDADISSSNQPGYNYSALELSVGFRLPSTDITRKTVQWERY
ncbi:PorP/SprF family type IX secretion system membrane protein [Marinilabiliaceae bacterium ANBcel2]|nr:PorP/SprF family type IX secretion system membrane protein [Marinilabiliaceae bacterium ANBcel2]